MKEIPYGPAIISTPKQGNENNKNTNFINEINSPINKLVVLIPTTSL